MSCKQESCFKMSQNRTEICLPYFDKNKTNELTNFGNSNHLLIGLTITIGIWLCFANGEFYEYFTNFSQCPFLSQKFGFIKIMYHKNTKKKEEIIQWFISRFISVLLFSVPVIVLTIKGSNKETFCLMNRKEPICSNYWNKKLDCFQHKTDFSGFVKIGQGYLRTVQDSKFSHFFQKKGKKSVTIWGHGLSPLDCN